LNHADDGEAIDGLPTEGVEITCFSLVSFFYNVSIACFLSYSSQQTFNMFQLINSLSAME